jgi:energy-coupling factor transporter ATP-binding protein EcfA2
LHNPNHQLFMDTVRNEVLLNCGDGRAVDELLESFSLAHLGDRHPYSLSEGEKRRTALAAVLAARPSVLLLDEPTLGQDRDSLIKMIGALRRHSIKEGLTVLTVTHDEAAARALGDRVIMFYGGRAGECNDDCLESYFGAHARSGLIA